MEHEKKRIASILVSVLVVAIAGALAYTHWNSIDPGPGQAGRGPASTGSDPATAGTGSVSTGSVSTESGNTGSRTGSVSADESAGFSGAGAGTGFVVSTSAAVGDPLVPGGPTQTVAFTVTNPGSAGQILTDVSVTIADTGGGEWTAGGCSAADYTVGAPAIRYGEIAPSGVVAGTVTVGMNNLTLNQDACKNVVVPLRFVALRR
jgi:hypothetical protein